MTDENEVDVGKATMNPSTVETEQDDYNKCIQLNTKLIPPPSWVPNQSDVSQESDKRTSLFSQNGRVRGEQVVPCSVLCVKIKTNTLGDENAAEPKTQLAAMLAKDCKGADVWEWFPRSRQRKLTVLLQRATFTVNVGMPAIYLFIYRVITPHRVYYY